MIDTSKLSPMMKRYMEIKAQYPDCLLFFRLGDFYEMFFEDAERRHAYSISCSPAGTAGLSGARPCAACLITRWTTISAAS